MGQQIAKEAATEKDQSITGLLDAGVFFEGCLTFEGTVRVGGHIKGEIITKGTLVVEPGAKIEANIQANTVVVSGYVEGSIVATQSVSMHPPATFKGQVTSPSLSIAEGVVFEGASYMLKDKKTPPIDRRAKNVLDTG